MNTTHNAKTKQLIAALGVAAAAAVAPALLLAGAATAHADSDSSPFPTISDNDLSSVRAVDPGGLTGGFNPQPSAPLWPTPQPVPGASAWAALPQDSSPITAIFDGLGIPRGW